MKNLKLFLGISFFLLALITFLGTTNLGPKLITSVLASQSISAKALTDHECNADEWHFVITGIDTEADAPASITVFWGGISEVLPLDKFTGGTAHYKTTDHLDLQVTGANASIYDAWSGQFNLSHGPCNVPTPTPTSPTDTPTNTPSLTPTDTPTNTPTLTPTDTPTPTSTNTPTPTSTLTPTPTIIECPQGQTFDNGLHICIQCDGGGTCEVTTGESPTPTPTSTPEPTATPTPGESHNDNNNNNNSSNNSSSNNSSSSSSSPSQGSVLGANTFAGTGAFEDTFSNITLISGILTTGAGLVYGKKKAKKSN